MNNKQEFIENNVNLVYFIVRKYYPTFIHDEDIIQCGMVGLCKAVDAWDMNKSKFSTYARKCILNEINMEFRNRKKDKGVVSLDKEIITDSGETVSYGDLIAGEADIPFTDMDGFLNSLSVKEKIIFDCFKSGMSSSEIMEKLHCSKDLLNKNIRSIKRKWRKITYDETW